MDNGRHLYLSKAAYNGYMEGMRNALSVLKKHLKNKQYKRMQEDLQLIGNNFNEAVFLQSACETSVCASIARMYPDGFEYEPKTNPPKDVDCSFEVDGYRFNIEVKCADYSRKHTVDKSDGFKVGAMGRYSNYHETIGILEKMFKGVASGGIVPQINMDNKLKDFLVSAHTKFGCNVQSKELNVLVVCCDDIMDVQRWYSYMFESGGMFTETPFSSDAEYSKVDAVILSNVYHRHYHFWQKNKIFNHWKLEDSFNLIFSSPYRKYDKRDCILKLVGCFPNYSEKLCGYRNPSSFDSLKISYFVIDELINNGVFCFQPAK